MDCKTEIDIPQGTESIGENAFYGCNNLTIYGYRGSQVEIYAKENDIPFVALDEPAASAGDVNGDKK